MSSEMQVYRRKVI